MTEKIIIAIISAFSGIAITLIAAYFKIREEKNKLKREFKFKLAQVESEDVDISKIAKQFAIGMFLIIDPEKPSHKEKILLPPHTKITIGRGEKNDVKISCNFTSRDHLLVSTSEDSVFIEDMITTNGTLVNGEPIDSCMKLTCGDYIQLGEAELLFKKLQA